MMKSEGEENQERENGDGEREKKVKSTAHKVFVRFSVHYL